MYMHIACVYMYIYFSRYKKSIVKMSPSNTHTCILSAYLQMYNKQTLVLQVKDVNIG